jgi:site-specific DNA-methyltransferase (cytosine-N4-specific)
MTARLLVGDVNERIGEIPDGTVDAVICSPPFLALRKYGGDDAEMGSEANPAAFIDALLELTAQFRRVLAPHGSIAIELGDTYSGSGGAGGDYNENGLREGQPAYKGSAARKEHRVKLADGRTIQSAGISNGQRRDGEAWPLAKSLAGIPEAYMLSLAYGHNVLHRNGPDSPAGRWRVRNVVVWARPNPPVGALGDKVRPATSYITIACTSAKRWFDLDAVRAPGNSYEHDMRYSANGYSASKSGNSKRADSGVDRTESHPAGAPPLDWWEDDDPTGHATLVLPTQPYPGAHYATWPPTLAKRLVEMLCPLRVCTVCGEPSRRITGQTPEYAAARARVGHMSTDEHGRVSGSRAAQLGQMTSAENVTLGWTDCGHDAWRNGHVLDPFAGSGTTLAVAHGCGRDATGIELYPDNADLIADRLGMFLEVVA